MTRPIRIVVLVASVVLAILVAAVRPPDEPGLRVTEMSDEVDEGNLRGMYVVGENPAISEPDLTNARESLEELEFLAVQDVFMTETAEYADVVLRQQEIHVGDVDEVTDGTIVHVRNT